MSTGGEPEKTEDDIPKYLKRNLGIKEQRQNQNSVESADLETSRMEAGPIDALYPRS